MFGKSENREDYQGIPRPVGGMARDLPARFFIPYHEHPRGQLIYATSGAILVHTQVGSWIVPPQRAVWVPPQTQHSMQTCGPTALRTLYLRADVIPEEITKCCVIAVSPLLRELIAEAAAMPVDYDEAGRDGLAIKLLLWELRPVQIIPLHLPFPLDSRILKICQEIVKNPNDETSIDGWGDKVGASGRTIIRQFQSETGLSFRRWKQQARLMSAIQMLAEGKNVADAASLSGYESPSAFSAMFKRLLGVTPSEYFVNSQ
ncbi:AraC family transcriptional regulator [Variovorax sp. RA8]|uniref:AraC family transcriptional regulator n=1 Tax=Variovorax sp. (strain JCM 16519 / RA8) TaxID=662548 RepID=UPI000AB1902F|nr:helix-turn-helix transcriptional regulator [Variovorax sp. RA8]VTU14440.1 HTH-type transcriptional repressor of iron proteins A [Variovorax sp. RA8]